MVQIIHCSDPLYPPRRCNLHLFLQFKKIPTFIGDGEIVSSKASLEQALSFATGVTTEKRTLYSLIFQQITYDEENVFSCC